MVHERQPCGGPRESIPFGISIKRSGTRPALRAQPWTVACALLMAGTAVHAQGAAPDPATASDIAAARSELGFSYLLGLGAQSVTYRENSEVPVRSKATSTSPLIVSGALYAINQDLLFSLSNETTFAPGSTTETWTATSADLDGHALTDPTVQRNGFSLSQNTTQLLGHYRVAGNWFVVAGPALHTQTFKRYSFVEGADDAVTLPTDRTIEESTNEVLANVGVALDSARVRGQSSHYGLRAVLGLPVWSRTSNTEYPGVNFKSQSGYDLSLEGRCSWAIFSDIHAGFWGQWMTSERHRAVVNSSSGTLELPESRLTSLSYGVELLWKL